MKRRDGLTIVLILTVAALTAHLIGQGPARRQHDRHERSRRRSQGDELQADESRRQSLMDGSSVMNVFGSRMRSSACSSAERVY